MLSPLFSVLHSVCNCCIRVCCIQCVAFTRAVFSALHSLSLSLTLSLSLSLTLSRSLWLSLSLTHSSPSRSRFILILTSLPHTPTYTLLLHTPGYTLPPLLSTGYRCSSGGCRRRGLWAQKGERAWVGASLRLFLPKSVKKARLPARRSFRCSRKKERKDRIATGEHGS